MLLLSAFRLSKAEVGPLAFKPLKPSKDFNEALRPPEATKPRDEVLTPRDVMLAQDTKTAAVSEWEETALEDAAKEAGEAAITAWREAMTAEYLAMSQAPHQMILSSQIGRAHV